MFLREKFLSVAIRLKCSVLLVLTQMAIVNPSDIEKEADSGKIKLNADFDLSREDCGTDTSSFSVTTFIENFSPDMSLPNFETTPQQVSKRAKLSLEVSKELLGSILLSPIPFSPVPFNSPEDRDIRRLSISTEKIALKDARNNPLRRKRKSETSGFRFIDKAFNAEE